MALKNKVKLRNFIATLTGIKTLNHYDGLELTPDMKPIIIVQSLNGAHISGSATKLKDSVGFSELYQIIVYSETSRQQDELCVSISDALFFHEFDDFIVQDNISVQPVHPESVSDELNKHRAFISVTLQSRKNRRN